MLRFLAHAAGGTMVLFGAVLLLEGLVKALRCGLPWPPNAIPAERPGWHTGRTLGGAVLVAIGGALIWMCWSG